MKSLEAWRYAIEEGASAAEVMDEAVEQAPTRPTWDCAAGCAACCHLRVEVTPAEVEALLPFVTAAVAERIRTNAAAAREVDTAGYRRARIPCAFLDADSRCVAYAARPVRCRSHVSSDVATCEAAFEGSAASGAIPGDGWLRSVASAVQRGLGGETRELHAAIVACL